MEELGRWGSPLARQHEVGVLRLLAALVTALYTTFPTTIQQVRDQTLQVEDGDMRGIML